MITKEMKVNNKSGLQAKTAAIFIQKASSFKASIWIEKGERKANAKSLLGLLSLCIADGNKVVVTADGEDEAKAIIELEEYLNSPVMEVM